MAVTYRTIKNSLPEQLQYKKTDDWWFAIADQIINDISNRRLITGTNAVSTTMFVKEDIDVVNNTVTFPANTSSVVSIQDGSTALEYTLSGNVATITTTRSDPSQTGKFTVTGTTTTTVTFTTSVPTRTNHYKNWWLYLSSTEAIQIKSSTSDATSTTVTFYETMSVAPTITTAVLFSTAPLSVVTCTYKMSGVYKAILNSTMTYPVDSDTRNAVVDVKIDPATNEYVIGDATTTVNSIYYWLAVQSVTDYDDNPIDYTLSDGVITLDAAQSGDTVEIDIKQWEDDNTLKRVGDGNTYLTYKAIFDDALQTIHEITAYSAGSPYHTNDISPSKPSKPLGEVVTFLTDSRILKITGVVRDPEIDFTAFTTLYDGISSEDINTTRIICPDEYLDVFNTGFQYYYWKSRMERGKSFNDSERLYELAIRSLKVALYTIDSKTVSDDEQDAATTEYNLIAPL